MLCKDLTNYKKVVVLTNGASIVLPNINYLPNVIKLTTDTLNNKFWQEGPLQIIDDNNKRILKFTDKYKK